MSPSLGITAFPRFKPIVVSHHDRAKSTSVAATVWQAFLSPDAALPAAHFIDARRPQFATIDDRSSEYVVVFNGLGSLLQAGSASSMKWAKQCGLKRVVYWHETSWMLQQLTRRWSSLWNSIGPDIVSADVTHWVPTGQSAQAVSAFLRVPIDRFLIVGEVVDLKKFRPEVQRNQYRNRPVVVGSGLINSRKGVDIFAKAAQVSRNAYPADFVWYSTSSESEPSWVPDGERAAVEWRGQVDDFERVLASADLFLLTSRDDPSPLVAFEALACGVPVLALATTGFAEILPRDCVFRSEEDLIAGVARFVMPNGCHHESASLRQIAEDFGVDNFLKAIARTPVESPADSAHTESRQTPLRGLRFSDFRISTLRRHLSEMRLRS